MSSSDNKLDILKLLNEEATAMTAQEIAKNLKSSVSDRTLRRWLEELTQEGIIIKSGRTRGTKYQAIIHQKSEKLKASNFSPKSLKILEKVSRPLFERDPKPYNSEWLESYRPNQTFYLSEAGRGELREKGSRELNHDPAGTYARQIYNRLLIDLSYNSSRLEGNTYSQLDTERLIISGNAATGKLDEEKVMILNHKEAIRYLVERAPQIEADKNSIYTLHYLLSDGLVEPQYAGKVRDHWVRITGSAYIPFDNPKLITQQLEKITQKAEQIDDPFEQSLFLLVHLSYLQAFTDVNKRTARLASNIPLVKRNLVPLSFNDIEREDYASALLAIYEYQEVELLLDLYQFSYKRTCLAYDSTSKAMGFDEVRIRFRSQRRELIREILLNQIHGTPLKKLIEKRSEGIPLEHRSRFIQNIHEDLKELDMSRIAGLGITEEELRAWQIQEG